MQGLKPELLYRQEIGGAGKAVHTSFRRKINQIFQPDAAPFPVVKSRFNGKDFAAIEFGVAARGEAWGFVDLQSDTVTKTMEESERFAVRDSGAEVVFGKNVFCHLVQ